MKSVSFSDERRICKGGWQMTEETDMNVDKLKSRSSSTPKSENVGLVMISSKCKNVQNEIMSCL